MAHQPIQFFNRYSNQVETESVYGEAFLRWTYSSWLGRSALFFLVQRAFFSKWYGWRMKRPGTRSKIATFIQHYQVKPEEFLEPVDRFQSFNDFFIRKLKPEARPIHSDPNSVVFPADGRHMGFANIAQSQGFFVKGQRFDVARLIGDPELAERYLNGSLVLSRLCPVDYHRFHFPCAGMPGPSRLIDGPLFSVSPIALRRRLDYLWQNKRALTELQTELFGNVMLIEIGATCVGSIVQTFDSAKPVNKGDEKGYFEFGGSSTITLFEPGKIQLSQDLLEKTSQHIELYARMGDCIGRKIN